jgi:hypothetical protein
MSHIDYLGHFGGLVFGALTTAATVKQNGSQFRRTLRLVGTTQVAFLGVLSLLVLYSLAFEDCSQVVYLGKDKAFHKLADDCSGMCVY